MAPVLARAHSVLEETLLHGLVLFDRYAKRPEGGNHDDLIILFVYRHLLELLDSVTIQIAECAPATAALQLRAMFESLLYIEYLTEDKSKTSERAIAFPYQIQRQRRKFYLSQDPNTPEGKALREFIADAPLATELKKPNMEQVNAGLCAVAEIIDTDEYSEVAKAYAEAKKTTRFPSWYSLYNGPKTLGQLAKHLKQADCYHFLYGEWSDRTHASDIVDRILTHDSAGPAARALRDVTEFSATVKFAQGFSFDAMGAIIRHYRPGDEAEHTAWFRREILPLPIPDIKTRYSED
jgi:hypothetical protein